MADGEVGDGGPLSLVFGAETRLGDSCQLALNLLMVVSSRNAVSVEVARPLKPANGAIRRRWPLSLFCGAVIPGRSSTRSGTIPLSKRLPSGSQQNAPNKALKRTANKVLAIGQVSFRRRLTCRSARNKTRRFVSVGTELVDGGQ